MSSDLSELRASETAVEPSDECALRPRVVLIEDQVLFSDVMQSVLERAGTEVVATCTTGGLGLETVKILAPDIALIDLGLPDRPGLKVGNEILAQVPNVKVVALSAHDDPATVRGTMRAGFAGYLTKHMSTQSFVEAFSAIAAGRRVFPHQLVPSRQHTPTRETAAAMLASHLTVREKEVLGLIAQGVPSRAIAETLGMSLNTVRSHVQSILTKLQVHSRLEAAAFARQHRIVAAPDPVVLDCRAQLHRTR